MTDSQPASAGPKVPAGLYLKTRVFEATRPLWRQLARLESAVLRDELREIPIREPIYIAGVARSGTTILTEMLSRHPDVTSHRYSDFPNIYTPYWRNWLAQRVRRSTPPAVERAHRDRVMVTPESPEAVEEVIWMAHFDGLHDASRSQILGPEARNEAFERHYLDHIRKLLLVRGRSRYLTKGNYNVSRVGYIRKLFPDARILVPIRSPISHVASLVKQDRLFTRAAGADSRVVKQLHRSGHFEFGPDKRCIHTGDDRTAGQIQADWADGNSVAAWARYWASVHECILDFCKSSTANRDSVLFVPYEELCNRSAEVIDRVIGHCRLPAEKFGEVRDEYADRLAEPGYYSIEFDTHEARCIEEICGPVAARLGYAIACSEVGTPSHLEQVTR